MIILPSCHLQKCEWTSQTNSERNKEAFLRLRFLAPPPVYPQVWVELPKNREYIQHGVFIHPLSIPCHLSTPRTPIPNHIMSETCRCFYASGVCPQLPAWNSGKKCERRVSTTLPPPLPPPGPDFTRQPTNEDNSEDLPGAIK